MIGAEVATAFRSFRWTVDGIDEIATASAPPAVTPAAAAPIHAFRWTVAEGLIDLGPVGAKPAAPATRIGLFDAGVAGAARPAAPGLRGGA